MVRGYKETLTRRPDKSWEAYRRATLDDVEDWVGWEVVLKLLLQALRTKYYRQSSFSIEDSQRMGLRRALQFRDISLETILFLTGGRVTETLMLHRKNFQIRSDRVVVRSMPLLKRYTVTRTTINKSKDPPQELGQGQRYHWDKTEQLFVTEQVSSEPRVVKRRNFPLPLWEKPLMDLLLLRLRWSEQQEGKYKWLFPTPKIPTRTESTGVQKWIDEEFKIETRAWLSSTRAYQILRRLGQRAKLIETAHIWPHWYRIMRASELGGEYEFETGHLNAFFGWTAGGNRRTPMAVRYARVGSRRIWRRFREGREEVRAELDAASEAVEWPRKTRRFWKYWETILEET